MADTKKQKARVRRLESRRRAEISRQGGKAAHEKGTAHKWTKEEASAAGRKGGLAAHGLRTKPRRPTNVDADASYSVAPAAAGVWSARNRRKDRGDERRNDRAPGE